jgi:hypothetical protein
MKPKQQILHNPPPAARFLLLRTLTLITVILAAFPILSLVLLGRDAILPIVLYFQLLLLWGQIEIAQKQHVLVSMQYEPSFSVETEPIDVYGMGEVRTSVHLHNTSKNTAYNVMVGRILGEKGVPIPPDMWKGKINSEFISSMSPDQKSDFCWFDNSMLKDKFTIEVLYNNQLGEWRDFHILFFEGDKVMIIPARTEAGGFLLELFRDLALMLKFRRLRKLETTSE